MRPRNSSYVPQDSIFPFEGLDYDTPSTMLDPHHSPDIDNIEVDKGHVRKRRGFSLLGDTINGTPLAMFEFETLSGIVHLLLITTTKEYQYDTGSGDWLDITYREPAGNTIVPRTGTEEDGLDYVIVTGLDVAGLLKKWVIVTNGVDKPRYWDGTLTQFYEYSTATVANRGAGVIYSNFVTMKTMSVINAYLIMANVTTTSNEPTTVAWTDTGSLVNWGTSTSPPPGNSGAIPLTDASGPLIKCEPLGDRMMIYGDDTIHAMYHVGGNDIFGFEKLISGTRIVGPRAIVNVRGFHLFMAQENILLFDGSRSLRPVADRIAIKMREQLSTDLRKRAWGFLDIAKNQVYWAVPTSSNVTIIYKMEYNEYDVLQIKWTKISYTNKRITAMGFWKQTTGLRWNDPSIATLTWQAAAMNWDQGSLRGGFPKRLVGYGNSVGLQADQVWYDDDELINSNYDTIDLTVPKEYLSGVGRWLMFECELRGNMVDVLYSKSRGSNYQKIVKEQPLTGEWQRYQFDLDEVAETLRFRFENDGAGGFEVRSMRAWVAPAGER